MTTGHGYRLVVLATTAVLATGLTACGGGGDDDALPAPPASAESGPTAPAVDPAHQPILDAYYGSVDAMVAAQQADDPEHPDLSRYFVERTPAYHGVMNTINNNRRRGMYYAGDLVVVAAEVTEIDPEAEPPKATVESCLDYSNYQLVYREDDSPVEEAEEVGRVTITAELVQDVTDGRWYVLTNTPHWDEAC
ncbi:MAG TPA: hypothetical protein VIL37_05610 [Natronosporangium sp.]